MELRAYIKSLPDDEQRERFASGAGTTLGHLRNIAYGLRPCGAELATQVELGSAGAVRRWELRPDDWHRIWPELIGAEGAPSVAEAA